MILTPEEREDLGHRIAWRYKKSSDPNHSDTYTFNADCLDQFAAAIERAVLRKLREAGPVAFEYRHILSTLRPSANEVLSEWRPVEPRDYLQTLEQRIQELRGYRYEGRPCYEVRALFTIPEEQTCPEK